MHRVLFLILIASSASCTPEGSKPSDAPEPNISRPQSEAITIAILGDGTAQKFVKELKEAGIKNAVIGDQNDLAARIGLLTRCDAAVILVNCADGPMPLTREDVILAQRFCDAPVMIGFTNSNLIDDPELIELIVLETQELFETYELATDEATTFFDSKSAATDFKKGYEAIAEALKTVKRRKPKSDLTMTSKSEIAGIYALADVETFERGVAGQLKDGTYHLIIEGESCDARLTFDSPLDPGEDGDVKIQFDEPQKLPAFSRFVISSPHHVLAIGFASFSPDPPDFESNH